MLYVAGAKICKFGSMVEVEDLTALSGLSQFDWLEESQAMSNFVVLRNTRLVLKCFEALGNT